MQKKIKKLVNYEKSSKTRSGKIYKHVFTFNCTICKKEFTHNHYQRSLDDNCIVSNCPFETEEQQNIRICSNICWEKHVGVGWQGKPNFKVQ
jgi:hypothetical protein